MAGGAEKLSKDVFSKMMFIQGGNKDPPDEKERVLFRLTKARGSTTIICALAVAPRQAEERETW